MSMTRIPEPWKSFLEAIDGNVNRNFDLHCMGGFVVTTLWGAPRKTGDVDVLTIQPGVTPILDIAGKGSELHRRYKLYIDHVTVLRAYPDNYDRRLTEIFPRALKHLRLFALDPHDLALTKLERNAPRDLEDVMHLARTAPLDLDLLRDRYRTEMRPYLSNEKWHDQTLGLWIGAIQEERSRERGRSR
jgi:hypothetical protein